MKFWILRRKIYVSIQFQGIFINLSLVGIVLCRGFPIRLHSLPLPYQETSVLLPVSFILRLRLPLWVSVRCSYSFTTKWKGCKSSCFHDSNRHCHHPSVLTYVSLVSAWWLVATKPGLLLPLKVTARINLGLHDLARTLSSWYLLVNSFLLHTSQPQIKLMPVNLCDVDIEIYILGQTFCVVILFILHLLIQFWNLEMWS